jgi:8-oxo-dGTP diphosphatase
VTRRRRIAAYGICRREDGRVLMVGSPGALSLPGGGIRHGEHPAAAVVRQIAEETGLVVTISAVREVTADLVHLPDGTQLHQDRVLYEAAVTGGTLNGGAVWRPEEELTYLEYIAPPAPTTDEDQPRVQRFAAYGLVEAEDGRVLLTRIAAGYPGAGRWHAPGGGTDFGEQPTEGLLRELYEETGQYGRVRELLGVEHRHNPAAMGPEGYPIDWHSVRALFRLAVDVPTEPTVTEAAGGSTAAAAWFPPEDLARLKLSEVAMWATAHRRRRGRRVR